MILDTSALIAILRNEPDSLFFAQQLANRTEPCRISAANYLEASIVIDSGRNPLASRFLDDLLDKADIRIEAVTVRQATIARNAYRTYGKGSGHPARLNFGDCFAYALAKETSECLLFKGDDFIHTDIILRTVGL
ncbi:MAG: type II toxin-antitoxin system VapC family toxin [Magnetococcales bacterium]|nr:type II toxin-antitoxin system VapC family toxin [Magnetococcales bacterium]